MKVIFTRAIKIEKYRLILNYIFKKKPRWFITGALV